MYYGEIDREIFKAAFSAARAGVDRKDFLAVVKHRAPAEWDPFYDGSFGKDEFILAKTCLRFRKWKGPSLEERLVEYKDSKRSIDYANFLAEHEMESWILED